MGTYVLRQAVQWSFFGTHGNMPGSSQPDTRETLGLAIRLVFLLLLIFAIADRSTAIAGFTLGQKLTGVGGNAVAIAGERIVVGAPAEDGAKGAVHVYRYNSSTATWIEEQKLIALDGRQVISLEYLWRLLATKSLWGLRLIVIMDHNQVPPTCFDITQNP